MVPFSLPIRPMLASAATELPDGAPWVFEPKWDGFRAIVAQTEQGLQIWSRNQRRLDRFFPDLCLVLERQLSVGTVIDGELVVVTDGRLDFEDLLGRLSRGGKALARAAAETPATLIAFDLLAADDTDQRRLPLSERRKRLEELLPSTDWLAITPQTVDRVAAARWYLEFGPRGFEGVIAKRASDPYREGGRQWLKVRWRRTADCVVGGYAGRSLLLGMHGRRGVLHFVGSALPPQRDWAAIVAVLRHMKEQPAFVGGSTPATGRFTGQRLEEWTEVEPRLVCEVAYDQVTHGRFRHAVRFLRWRPDKDPAECLREDLTKPALGLLPVEAKA